MKPHDYVAEMQKAYEEKLYIAAASLATIIPDVCASALDGDSHTSAKKYISWLDAYFMPLTEGLTPFDFQSEDLYKLRCSLLHNGSLATDPGEKSSFHNIGFHIFDNSTALVIGEDEIEDSSCDRKEKTLLFNLPVFVECIAQAVDAFLCKHPECNKTITKDRFAYTGITFFDVEKQS